MIKMNCKKCGYRIETNDEYAGRRIHCQQCNEANIIPASYLTSEHYFDDSYYPDDNITPDFEGLFRELLKHEQEAPALEMSGR